MIPDFYPQSVGVVPQSCSAFERIEGLPLRTADKKPLNASSLARSLPVELVEYSVEYRRREQTRHRDEDETCVERKRCGEDFSREWDVNQIAGWSHSSEEHCGADERIRPTFDRQVTKPDRTDDERSQNEKTAICRVARHAANELRA